MAIAEAFRGDGERLCNPIGNLPLIGGRLAARDVRAAPRDDRRLRRARWPTSPAGPRAARAERVARARSRRGTRTRRCSPLLWNGKRHVMMGATQIDRYGNQNIACIGDWDQPRVASCSGSAALPATRSTTPPATGCRTTRPACSSRPVDVVCGIGYDRAARARPGGVALPRDAPGRVEPRACSTSRRPTPTIATMRSVGPPGRDRRRGRRGHRLRAGDPRRRARVPAADRRRAAR